MNPKQFIAQRFFEPSAEELRFLPEGPRVLQNYHGESSYLGWVAIQHGGGIREGSVNVLDLNSRGNRSIRVAGRPGFFCETTQPGVVLVGLERRLVYLDLVSGDVEEAGVEVTSDERVIINDGLAIDGGVLFGTKHLQFNLPIAALYHYDCSARQVRTVLDGQMCSNGKFFKRVESGITLVDIDSIPKAITRYKFDSQFEQILEQSLITAPDSLPAIPDGLRPAPDGESIVVAFYNPEPVADGLAQQIRLSDGAILCEWIVPGSPRVTCPEFVELDGKVKVLFTTATEGMPQEVRRKAPGAGVLYIADTPFDRLPEPPPLLRR